MLYNDVKVIYKASKDWLYLTGSFDFNVSDGTAAILGPMKEFVVVHVSKFLKANHDYNVINLGEESPEKKAGQCDVRYNLRQNLPTNTAPVVFIDALPPALRCNLRNSKICLIGQVSLLSFRTSCLYLDVLRVFWVCL